MWGMKVPGISFKISVIASFRINTEKEEIKREHRWIIYNPLAVEI